METAAEHAVLTAFRKPIWQPFIGALKKYGLLQANDSVAVCLSGGKDSLLLCACMKALARHSDFPFSLHFLAMDPGYARENRLRMEENAARLGIKPVIIETDIFNAASSSPSPCHVCASMRRGHLYKAAREMGCNKIALGHHMDDAAETALMSMLGEGKLKTMLPKAQSAHFPGMSLIRPLYDVREKEIIRWRDECSFECLDCACAVVKSGGGRRAETKKLLKTLEENGYPLAARNLINSLRDVNLQALIGYRKSADSQPETMMDGETDGEDI